MSVPIRPDRSEIVESDGPGLHQHSGASEVRRSAAEKSEEIQRALPHRILFLDDDHRRAEAFLGRNPEAVWIQTAEECVAKLAELWDEVYLDHDLGGEHYVNVERADCGMEVVRWLCKEPREHLTATKFIIHSHNLAAAMMMVLLMRETGYYAEFLPFGFSLEMDPFLNSTPKKKTRKLGHSRPRVPVYVRFYRWFIGLFARVKKPHGGR